MSNQDSFASVHFLVISLSSVLYVWLYLSVTFCLFFTSSRMSGVIHLLLLILSFLGITSPAVFTSASLNRSHCRLPFVLALSIFMTLALKASLMSGSELKVSNLDLELFWPSLPSLVWLLSVLIYKWVLITSIVCPWVCLGLLYCSLESVVDSNIINPILYVPSMAFQSPLASGVMFRLSVSNDLVVGCAPLKASFIMLILLTILLPPSLTT